MAKKLDDNIYLVNPPRNNSAPPFFDMEARGVKFPRVIPFYAHIDPHEYNDVYQKVRGKESIRMIFTVPTVRMKYKNSVWTNHTQFYLDIPMPTAARLGKKMVEVSERCMKKSKRKVKSDG